VSHGLVLQVVVPLMAAPLCVLLRSGRLAGWIAVLCGAFGLGNAIALLLAVRGGGTISYHLGGVAMPYGIEYRLDLLGAYVLLVLSAIVAVTSAWAARGVRAELGRARPELFFAIWLLCATGLYGIALSGYVLVAHGTERRALMAAFRYLIMGTVGATFILIGIGLLYAMTGTLNMQDLAARLPQVSSSRTVLAAFAFVSVGLCLKIAVFPLHLWLPSAYACAPAPVSAMLAGTATKVAVYLWLRFFFTVFAPSVAFAALPIDAVLLPLGLLGALVGSLIAVFQDEPKRLLAWSSIAQIGYLVVGISLATEAGVTAALSHVMNHAVVKTALFLALGAVTVASGAVGRPLRLRDLHGLSARMPRTAAAVVVGGLGLIGVPLTGGFIGKWLLVQALLHSGLWWAAVVVLVSSLLAVIYVWRLVEAMYFKPATDEPQGTRSQTARAGTLAAAMLWTLCLLSLWLGVHTWLNVDLPAQAAAQLFGPGGGR
jgi:multicomponent Na+:H+ antiporter subunit D